MLGKNATVENIISQTNFPPINELILKLASRCNINCSYCYWFRDPLVMSSPKKIQPEVITAFIGKLSEHISQFEMKRFSITFHGGEPTLFPLKRFEELCRSLKTIQQQTGCEFHLSMQSNGLLIDEGWIKALKKYKVVLGISMDGEQQVHDKYRIDHKGRGTYLRTVAAIEMLQAAGLSVYILSVADPQTGATRFVDHLVNQLGIKQFDVLIPHLHHENNVESISDYYCDLFDHYMDELIEQDVSIRILDQYMKQMVLTRQQLNHGPGYISTVTLLTDGTLEATDDLRGAEGLVPGKINIKTNELQQVCKDPLWQEIYYSSLNLSEKCQSCEFKDTCAGGPMATRWSDKNRFNNPSVYCDDLFEIMTHMKKRLNPHIDQTIHRQAIQQQATEC